MDYRDQIISAVAERECTRICRRVILALQRMLPWGPFDNDIPLHNLWDEVCVQVQSDESVMWGWYVDIMEQIIDAEVEKIDLVIRRTIWLGTNQGLDWAPDPEGDAECVPCSVQDIVGHILIGYVVSEAGSYGNARIRKYLRNRS